MQRSIVLSAMVLLSGLGGVARAEDPSRVLAVVVDRDNPRGDISISELKEIFQGKRKDWPDGARIIPLDLEPGGPREIFNRVVLGTDQAGADTYWVEQKVRGAAAPPKVVSAATALKLVPRVRGAIAYVPLSMVDPSVKVLSVGGLNPDKPGYPLAAK